MMDDECLNESEEQGHSLPSPEPRTPYSQTESRRKKLRYLLWTIAGLLVVVVILAFSIAFVNSTSSNGNSSSSASSNTRDPAFGSNTNEDGGMDFDYGDVGDGSAVSLGSFDNDSSYSSADDGGSYNPDNTFEPTFEPTLEATIDGMVSTTLDVV
mmetsp:Transcript_11316/g.23143  ORF Transcript_11316/g.23143 Transcript_11316/m.23143 type:complete len:155 (+) Transcript_11316:3435-3899(+)